MAFPSKTVFIWILCNKNYKMVFFNVFASKTQRKSIIKISILTLNSHVLNVIQLLCFLQENNLILNSTFMKPHFSPYDISKTHDYPIIILHNCVRILSDEWFRKINWEIVQRREIVREYYDLDKTHITLYDLITSPFRSQPSKRARRMERIKSIFFPRYNYWCSLF